MMGMGGVEGFATRSLTGTFSCATMGRKDDGRSGRITSLRVYRTVKCQFALLAEEKLGSVIS